MTPIRIARPLSVMFSVLALVSMIGCAHTVEDPDAGDPNGDPNDPNAGDDGGYDQPDGHKKKDSGKGDASDTALDSGGAGVDADDTDAIMTFDQARSTGRIPELP
jgi:hypothetical protein